MKSEIIKSLLGVLKNRTLVLFLVAMLILDIVCSIAVSMQITPSEITVYSRYTAFGQVHFYKDHWQYLLLFSGFFTLVAVIHGALMIKFYLLEKTTTAKAIGWCAFVIMLIAAMYAFGVLSLGRAA